MDDAISKRFEKSSSDKEKPANRREFPVQNAIYNNQTDRITGGLRDPVTSRLASSSVPQTMWSSHVR